MSNLALDITEQRLQKLILLLNNELIIKDGLHSLKITHVSKDGKSLQLLVILLMIQNSLWDHNISLNHL